MSIDYQKKQDGDKGTGDNFNFAASIHNYQFGGDGSDGALNVAAGTTTIDTSAGAVIKQYTSVTIAAGATLSKTQDSNPLIILVSGNVSISGTVNFASKGGSGGATATNGSPNVYTGTPSGGLGGTGKWNTNVSGGTQWRGTGGGGGGGAYNGGRGTFLGSAAYRVYDYWESGEPTVRDLIYPHAGAGHGGSGWLSFSSFLLNLSTPREFLISSCAGGGGGGSTGDAGGAAGGIGGGSLYMEVYGTYTTVAGSALTFNGANGSAGAGGGGGGGGGGAGSYVLKVNGTITNNAITPTVAGGTSGGAVGGAGIGGHGGNGIYIEINS